MAATDNPFDTQQPAPKVDGGLVADAMAPKGTNTAGNVATVDPNQFDNLAASKATATGYTAEKAATTAWNPDEKSTVGGQVNSILAADNPLVQQARTRASQVSAGRGLINSSMAVQAGEGAVIDKALQIAAPDAATFATAGRRNADAADSKSEFNVGQANAAAQFGANANNSQSQFNADADNALQNTKIDTTGRIQTTNAAAKNDATRLDAQTGAQAQVSTFETAAKFASQNAEAESRLNLATYDTASKWALQNADQQSKILLAKTDAETRAGVAATEAKFRVQMQGSAALAGTYGDMVKAISGIMSNPDYTAASKDKLIKQQRAFYEEAMGIQARITGLDLDGLLGPADGAPADASVTDPTQPSTITQEGAANQPAYPYTNRSGADSAGP